MLNIDWDNISKLSVSMSVVLAMLVIFVSILLYVWHKDRTTKINLTDLVCKDGKLDEKKFTRFGAWVVSTWGFVYLILDNKFTEWYFTGYMAIWVGNVIVDKYINNKNLADPKLIPSKMEKEKVL